MDILRKLFGYIDHSSVGQPKISFGRYTDAYKEREKYQAWDKSMAAFEEGNYAEYFSNFFFYLRDDDLENVKFSTSEHIAYFEIYQGSKLLVGTADNKNIRVEAKIAKTNNLNIGLLRRLLELNFTLKYGRYALDDNNWLTMVFEAKTSDTNPYKLYYGLKELALNADKQDDILESEFSNLESINNSHIVEISASEKRTKYEYLKGSIGDTLHLLENTSLNLDKFPGASSYVLLDLIYKNDYLLKPEGKTMELFEKMHRMFFVKNGESPASKNQVLLHEFEDLHKVTFEDFSEELYEVNSTFGITQPSGHERLVEFIQTELPNSEYYYSNGHDVFAQSIFSYIVGYCLFNFSLPSPDKAFLHLFYMISESDYFTQLGFSHEMALEGVLNKSNIKREIKNICKTYHEEYGEIAPDFALLNFESKLKFSRSYLTMLASLKLSPSKNAAA